MRFRISRRLDWFFRRTGIIPGRQKWGRSYRTFNMNAQDSGGETKKKRYAHAVYRVAHE